MNELFLKLHRLDWQTFQNEANMGVFEVKDYIHNKLAIIGKKLKQDNLIELIPIVEWLKKNNKQIEVELAVTHGDFHPHNIMISDEGQAFVIDWAACSIRDFREDLGWSLLLTGAYTSREIRNEVLKSYEFCKKKEIAFIEYFEVLAALRRLWDILTIFQQGAGSLGLREEARTQILETKFHLEYVLSLIEENTGLNLNRLEKLIQSILSS
jgi:aminoglycoside phosphotransferase (APT) family kinase protein